MTTTFLIVLFLIPSAIRSSFHALDGSKGFAGIEFSFPILRGPRTGKKRSWYFDFFLRPILPDDLPFEPGQGNERQQYQSQNLVLEGGDVFGTNSSFPISF